MTPEELELELEKLKGNGFERTVIEAYRRALLGRKFVYGDTDNIWWFLPEIGDRKEIRIHRSKRGESVGMVDWYSFYAKDDKIYIQFLSKTYEFETYSRDENDMVTATIRLDGNTILLRQVKG